MLLLFILIYNVFCQEIAMVFSAAKVNRQDELVMVLKILCLYSLRLFFEERL